MSKISSSNKIWIKLLCKYFLLDASIRFADRALEVSEKDGTVNATVELVGGIVSSRDITVLVETTSNTATGELSNQSTAFKNVGHLIELQMNLNLPIFIAKLLIRQVFLPPKFFTIKCKLNI